MVNGVKIGISGAQSVGKTTLLNALRSEPLVKSYHVCSEITRRIKSYGISINEAGNDLTQRIVMQEHAMNIIMHDNMITDRTSLDGLVYTTWLHKNGNVSDETLKYAQSVFKRIQPMYYYQFYIVPEFDIVNDGVRSVNLQFRDDVADLFNQIIDEYSIEVIKVTGSVRERVSQIISSICN